MNHRLPRRNTKKPLSKKCQINKNEKKKNTEEEKEGSRRDRAEGRGTVCAIGGRWHSSVCVDVVDAAS